MSFTNRICAKSFGFEPWLLSFYSINHFKDIFPAAGVTIPEEIIFGFWFVSGTIFGEFP